MHCCLPLHFSPSVEPPVTIKKKSTPRCQFRRRQSKQQLGALFSTFSRDRSLTVWNYWPVAAAYLTDRSDILLRPLFSTCPGLPGSWEEKKGVINSHAHWPSGYRQKRLNSQG